MSDLNITQSGVAVVTTSTATQIPTVTATGTAGGTILPGQVVYADPSVNGVLRAAQANNILQAANVVGIALGSAAPGQPLSYAFSGDVILPTSAPGTLVSGVVYVLSATNAGSLTPTQDSLASGNYVTVVGMGNGTVAGSATTSIFRLSLIPVAAPKI